MISLRSKGCRDSLGVLFFLACLAVCSPFNPAVAFDLDGTFEKTELLIGGRNITAYVADDDEKRERGLMFVEKLPRDMGMIFVFDNQRTLAFWMKNTLIPLSIGFFAAGGRLVDVQEMKVASSMVSSNIPSYQSKTEARLALEMNSGWFKQNKIRLGSRLELKGETKSKALEIALGRVARRK